MTAPTPVKWSASDIYAWGLLGIAFGAVWVCVAWLLVIVIRWSLS
jgi:hypothetical protein